MTGRRHLVDVSVDTVDGPATAIAETLVDHVRGVAEAALDVLLAGRHDDAGDADPAELSVVLCDDATMTPLNAQWRGRSGPTDVLSFPQEEGEALALPPGVPRQLGDLVISVDTARRQAAELKHGLEEELRVLVVHGLLHLLGHDHETGPDDAARMQAEERRVLAALGGGQGLIGR
ncbi:MAG: rRNA maturation RNase YbeY [Deltaproteobacteria bacterium]|nr:MAG: rRNA maturation RNase YbeY [Deltaproteobacteria bacterium]